MRLLLSLIVMVIVSGSVIAAEVGFTDGSICKGCKVLYDSYGNPASVVKKGQTVWDRSYNYGIYYINKHPYWLLSSGPDFYEFNPFTKRHTMQPRFTGAVPDFSDGGCGTVIINSSPSIQTHSPMISTPAIPTRF